MRNARAMRNSILIAATLSVCGATVGASPLASPQGSPRIPQAPGSLMAPAPLSMIPSQELCEQLTNNPPPPTDTYLQQVHDRCAQQNANTDQSGTGDIDGQHDTQQDTQPESPEPRPASTPVADPTALKSLPVLGGLKSPRSESAKTSSIGFAMPMLGANVGLMKPHTPAPTRRSLKKRQIHNADYSSGSDSSPSDNYSQVVADPSSTPAAQAPPMTKRQDVVIQPEGGGEPQPADSAAAPYYDDADDPDSEDDADDADTPDDPDVGQGAASPSEPGTRRQLKKRLEAEPESTYYDDEDDADSPDDADDPDFDPAAVSPSRFRMRRQMEQSLETEPEPTYYDDVDDADDADSPDSPDDADDADDQDVGSAASATE